MNMEEWYQKLLKFLEARDRAERNLEASREKLVQAIVEYIQAYFEVKKTSEIVRTLSEISLYVHRGEAEKVKTYLDNLDWKLMETEDARRRAVEAFEKKKHDLIEKIKDSITTW